MANAPFTIFGSFECVLIPSADNIDFVSNTKRYREHIVCSYNYKLKYVNNRYSKPYKAYFREDPIDKFLNDLIEKANLVLNLLKQN